MAHAALIEWGCGKCVRCLTLLPLTKYYWPTSKDTRQYTSTLLEKKHIVAHCYLHFKCVLFYNTCRTEAPRSWIKDWALRTNNQANAIAPAPMNVRDGILAYNATLNNWRLYFILNLITLLSSLSTWGWGMVLAVKSIGTRLHHPPLFTSLHPPSVRFWGH